MIRTPQRRASSRSFFRELPMPRIPTWMMRSTQVISLARRIGLETVWSQAASLFTPVEVRIDLNNCDWSARLTPRPR
jgi:hypothetical protein